MRRPRGAQGLWRPRGAAGATRSCAGTHGAPEALPAIARWPARPLAWPPRPPLWLAGRRLFPARREPTPGRTGPPAAAAAALPAWTPARPALSPTPRFPVTHPGAAQQQRQQQPGRHGEDLALVPGRPTPGGGAARELEPGGGAATAARRSRASADTELTRRWRNPHSQLYKSRVPASFRSERSGAGPVPRVGGAELGDCAGWAGYGRDRGGGRGRARGRSWVGPGGAGAVLAPRWPRVPWPRLRQVTRPLLRRPAPRGRERPRQGACPRAGGGRHPRHMGTPRPPEAPLNPPRD